MKRLYFLFLPLLFMACQNKTPHNNGVGSEGWTPPGPGTIVAIDSMKYKEDPLNNFYFAVKLTVSSENATQVGDYGFVYDLNTHCGPGEMIGRVEMPSGGRSLKPLLRRAPEGRYKYIIGFIAGKDLGGDGKTFQDLYSVTATKEKVEIKALKSYRFQ